MTTDYKATVFLPKTDFPMKAGLPKREPDMLARWEAMGLHDTLRAQSVGREKFILHDGPPYANGNLHIGHALNKILKDVINRSQQMMGKDAHYVPGWDCHGLPIEWKIEEQYRKKGDDKDAVDIVEFRQECREFAEHWIDVQREEFKRLGVMGDWDHPYTTMNFAAEAQIVAELGKFLMGGGLYRGAKPVLWSVVEKTALAEAEVEYHDHTSTQIWVKFPIVKSEDEKLTGKQAVIWTTTPWTIPGNRAVAYHPELDYVVLRVDAVAEDSLATTGDELIIARDLAAQFQEAIGVTAGEIIGELSGTDLAGAICRHPLDGQGYDFDVPLLPGAHVTAEDGTGLVHTAPGHGADDFVVGQEYGLDVPQTVGPDGLFYDHVPLFAGAHVYKVHTQVVEALTAAGALLAVGELVHSYPCSWRSKAPLIFRNTPQWFISMDHDGLRDKALSAIAETAFYPASGRNRLTGMIENRPDWCVSRQRAWGVPITVFVDKKSGEPLRDQAVLDRITDAVRNEGADVWFTSDASRFLGNEYDTNDYEQVTDILDVWFDSGSTHSFVLEAREDMKWPASLYLEGTDQHRGWFHSSLLESCGTRGRAPYEGVLTHGFVMGEDGQKMSKSLGNVVAPQDVVDQNGADILRLWVVGSDYSEDLRIGSDIVKHHSDIYRRLRNTLRYLLGNLNGFDESERLDPTEMPELERWVLHRIAELDDHVRAVCENFEFHTLFTELHNFCAVDLSAFYFDIRKDTLYCDRSDSLKRRAARTVLDLLFDTLTAWFAPFICFTAEEAWCARHPEDDASVHLRLFPDIPTAWRDPELADKWGKIRDLRRVVTGALEVERAEKRIGSSLQAHPVIHAGAEYQAVMDGLDTAEIAITSDVTLTDAPIPDGAFILDDVPGIGVVPGTAAGDKCVRCYRILPEVGTATGHQELCGRCADAVDHFPIAAE